MKLSSKNIFLIGLFFLLLGGLSIVLNHSGFALRLLGLSFWMIAVGWIFYIFEIRNER